MKEIHYFFAPDAEITEELLDEEARHAAKVLRLNRGDEIVLIDGKGLFHKAKVVEISPRSCRYSIYESERSLPTWSGRIHLAVAPTKNMERVEWLVEKAAEIGFDELSFVSCRFSERRTLRLDRIERILVSAVKQSRKAYLPKVNEMVPFEQFVKNKNIAGARYIAHCLDDNTTYEKHEEEKAIPLKGCRYYFPSILAQGDMTVLVGPEGDFSTEELNMALTENFVPVSLGNNRLRTETAALYAVMLMNLKNSLRNDGRTYVDVLK